MRGDEGNEIDGDLRLLTTGLGVGLGVRVLDLTSSDTRPDFAGVDVVFANFSGLLRLPYVFSLRTLLVAPFFPFVSSPSDPPGCESPSDEFSWSAKAREA